MNLDTVVSKHITSIGEITKTSHFSRHIFSTPSLTANVPKFTENHNSIYINIFMMSIGGVTALFLGILMRQLCIKCRSKRNNNSEQVSSNSQRNEGQGQDEEECYAEINESMMTERGYEDISEHLQLEKYSELQISSSLVAEPYDIINQQLPNRERTSSLVISTTSSESNTSNLLYLKPNNYINRKHSYLDVMGSSPANEVALIQSSLIQIADNSDPHSSFHNIDPINDVHIDRLMSRSCDFYDDNNTYLDVTNETIL